MLRKPVTTTLFAAALLLSTLPAMARDQVEVEAGAGYVAFYAPSSPGGYELRVNGPEGFHEESFFEPGEPPYIAFYDSEGYPLEDGSYRFELIGFAEARERGDGGEDRASKPGEKYSGAFTVSGGSLVDPDLRERFETKDQIIADDLIANSSLCVGTDCVNGENFSFDTIRLKENNLQIHFDDTSSSAEFPANDWRIVINDHANGGASYFAIEDSTAGKTPFKIAAGATKDSLYVADNGDVGFGTSTPAKELHTLDGDTPTLRLEQDGSSGFTPQVWDVGGNEVNFLITDVTNQVPQVFSIKTGAPRYSILVDSDGNVGLGVSNPSASLHVKRNDGTAQMLVEETAGSDGQVLARFVNSGAAAIQLEDSSLGSAWAMETTSEGNLRFSSNGNEAMSVDAGGNLSIAGSWDLGDFTAGSAQVASLEASNDVTAGALTVIGDATVGGALSAGDATTTSLSTSALNVSGDAAVSGSFSAGAATTSSLATSALNVSGDASVSGSFSAGDATVSSLSASAAAVSGDLSAGHVDMGSYNLAGTAETWTGSVDDSGNYVFNDASDETPEMWLEPGGDLNVQGKLKTKAIKMSSDRNLKTGIVALDQGDVLSRVLAMPISSWSFKDDLDERHIGPMAQDFFAAFGLGDSDRTISPLDASGVALVAIQGLYEQQEAQIRELRQTNQELQDRLAALEALISKDVQ